MTFIAKPKINYVGQARNALDLTMRDYEGTISTLCAGCGHDSISAALMQALFELDVPPHKIAKFSGIGCSSKTPAYFLGTPLLSLEMNVVKDRLISILHYNGVPIDCPTVYTAIYQQVKQSAAA